ncbi:DUF6789 family protein [Sphaerisporangium album]|uniref:DUF6789 family protein n=1 Tax=Sphaerisporangium album TaxID=509200 RepID=UPI0015F037E6|nr:DUF6789 family protein [Sphaerisporangium album]
MTSNLVKGGVGGLLATAAMSAVMLAADRAGLMGEHPPKRIVRAALPGHKHLPKPGERPLAVISHFAYGGFCGAVFAAATGRREPRVPLGVMYGLGIWVVSYQGWVPSAGILPPAHRDRPGRQLTMMAAHVVYGATLVLAYNALRRRERSRATRTYRPDGRTPPITPPDRRREEAFSASPARSPWPAAHDGRA